MGRHTAKPHDRLFTRLFARPSSAQALLREHLPPGLVARLLPGLPSPGANTYADDRLRGVRLDRLLLARIVDDEMPLHCIIEHRSGLDLHLFLRLFEYQLRVLSAATAERPEGCSTDPSIAFLVVYHGLAQWTLPTSYRQLVASAQYYDEALDFGYRLVDLGGVADAELSHEPGLRAGFMALKYATRPAQQPSALVEMIRAIEAVPGLERCLLEYVQETWSAIERATLWRTVEEVAPQMEETVKTIAEGLREEGREQGLERGRVKGKAELVTGQLQERFGALPEARLKQLESAKEPDLERWSRRLLAAADLDSVFD